MKEPKNTVYTFPWISFLIILGIMLLVASLTLTIGAASIPLESSVKIFLTHVFAFQIEPQSPASWDTIVWEIRLPRIFLAATVCASLALAGSTYQGIFQNHLADPYLIGVASGAGFGATLSLLIFGSSLTLGMFTTVPITAFSCLL